MAVVVLVARQSVLHDLGWLGSNHIRQLDGGTVALSWFALFLVKRENQTFSFLVLATSLVTAGCAVSSQLLLWFAPLILMAIATNSDHIAVRHTKQRIETPVLGNQSTFRFAYSLLALLVIWLGFCLSPSGAQALGGRQRTSRQLLGNDLPIQTREFLQQERPEGLMFSPAYWSDWLQATTEATAFANHDIHLIPETAQNDYQLIYSGHENWSRIADQYAVTDLLIDKSKQKNLVKRVRRSAKNWQTAYEDSQVILLRRLP